MKFTDNLIQEVVIMTNKIKQILQHKFLNIDGTLNKTVLVSTITLLIVLVDQILAMFNIVPAHQDQAVAILNTILTILSIFGFVEGPTTASIINPEKASEPRSTSAVSTSVQPVENRQLAASVAASAASDSEKSAQK